METKFYRLDGGRKNITAKITRSGFVQNELSPDAIIRFEGKAKYKRPERSPRRKIKIKAQSIFVPSKKDTVRAKTRPK